MSDVRQEALDALALALASHGHVWTDEERRLYDAAKALDRRADDQQSETVTMQHWRGVRFEPQA